jgi:hypothetical protein
VEICWWNVFLAQNGVCVSLEEKKDLRCWKNRIRLLSLEGEAMRLSGLVVSLGLTARAGEAIGGFHFIHLK